MNVFTVVRLVYDGDQDARDVLGVFGSRKDAMAYIKARWKRGIDDNIGFVESVLGQEVEHADCAIQWLK
jgi:hypothetical protein